MSTMYDKYAKIVHYADEIADNYNSLADWVNDIWDHFDVHGFRLEKGDPLEKVFGPHSIFLRYNDDVEGQFVAIMLYDQSKGSFSWNVADLTKDKHRDLRIILSHLFAKGYPDIYTHDLKMKKVITTEKQ